MTANTIRKLLVAGVAVAALSVAACQRNEAPKADDAATPAAEATTPAGNAPADAAAPAAGAAADAAAPAGNAPAAEPAK